MPQMGVIAGAQLIGSLYAGHKSNQRSSQEKSLIGAQTEQAKQSSELSKLLGGYAKSQYSLAEPAYTKAYNYYSTLLGGNRAAMNQAVAPEAQNIADSYRGAEGAIARTSRGGVRDTQMGEMARERSGALAKLTLGARPNAAATLGNMGQSMYSNAMSGLGGAIGGHGQTAGIYGNLLGDEEYNRNQNFQNMFGIGSSWAKMWMPYLLKKYGET